MSIYSIVLFLHIAGALGFFIVQGVEWIGLSQLRSAVFPEEAHAILGVLKRTNRLAFVSILTIVITGIYMMLTVWHGVPWILVVMGSLVLETVFFLVFSRPRMAAVEQALDAQEKPLSKHFHSLVNHPILWLSIQTRTAILLGIVFLKIAKPDLGGSLLTIAVAIVLGLASALPVLLPKREQARPAARMMIVLIVTVCVVTPALLAAKSIIANTIPFAITKSVVQNLQAKSSEVPTGVGSSNVSTQTPTSSSETALQEGSSLLQTRCTQCHSLKTIQQAKKTRAEWEKTLSKMESFGAKISDTEKNVLLDYITSVNKP